MNNKRFIFYINMPASSLTTSLDSPKQVYNRFPIREAKMPDSVF